MPESPSVPAVLIHYPDLQERDSAMKELIATIARALVDKSDEVVVSEREGNPASILELRVAKEDLGKIIGKQGRTAKALRTILSAASAKMKKRTMLEIIE
jgi:hypothetical protein